jgi:hypothetical protein
LRLADLNLHDTRAVAVVDELADEVGHDGGGGDNGKAILAIPTLGVGNTCIA